MKDRLISLKAVIDALEKAMCEDGFRSATGLIHKTTAYDIIRHLPSAQPEQRWIPVTKDTLPKEGKVVIVKGEKGTWDVGTYRGYDHIMGLEDIHQWIWKKNTLKKVYWWMYKDDALPEPYREEGEQE